MAERLTKWNKNKECMKFIEPIDWDAILDSLAAYEDLGSVEELSRLKEIQQWYQEQFEEVGEKLCDLENKIADGKLVEVVYGKWIKDRATIKCSECGFGMFPGGYYFMGGECISANDGNFRTKFCPNCGTEMEVGE